MLKTREPSISDKFAAAEKLWKRQPKILQTTHDIYLGDARTMDPLRRGDSVHLIVTSPPYWNLKQYSGRAGDSQLGHVDDRYEFLEELGKVWKRCFDLLVPGGRLCIVVGDVCRSRKAHGRHVVEPLHAYLQVQLQKLDFDPLAPIIWSKIANMKTEVAGNGSGFLGKPYEPNAIVKNDIEFILLFRKPGGYRHPTQEQRLLSLISKEDHARWFQQIWSDVPGQIQRDHPAPFPAEVAKRLIGMFSFVGDTVLDPFVGTANTTAAAIEMHRSSIGFEIEPAYFEGAKKRFSQPSFGTTVRFHDSAGR
jgi:site-specific DNA-methyltransferase (adenine-specific)